MVRRQRRARGRRHDAASRPTTSTSSRRRFESATSNAVIVPNFAIGAVLDDAVRRARRAVLRHRRDHRAPPRREGRRPVGHRDRHRASAWPTASSEWARRSHHQDGARRRARRRGRRRDPDPLGAAARAWSPTRRCCSAPRARRSPSATTPTTAPRTCPACCSRSRRSHEAGPHLRSRRAPRHLVTDGRRGESRERVLAGTYECVARVGIGKTTVEDVARASGVSRATVYRLFPGGRDELLRETVAWEMARFFAPARHASWATAPDFETFLERALPLRPRSGARARGAPEGARDRARAAHAAHHRRAAPRVSRTSRLLPAAARAWTRPRACSGRGSTCELSPSTSPGWRCRSSRSPGRHDLEDPDEVRRLVRGELLGGVPDQSSTERDAGEQLRQQLLDPSSSAAHGCMRQYGVLSQDDIRGRPDAGGSTPPRVHRPLRADQDHARRRRPRGRLLPGHALPLLRRQARARTSHRRRRARRIDRAAVAAAARRSRRSPTRSSRSSSPPRASSSITQALQFLLAHEPEQSSRHLAFGPGRPRPRPRSVTRSHPRSRGGCPTTTRTAPATGSRGCSGPTS